MKDRETHTKRDTGTNIMRNKNTKIDMWREKRNETGGSRETEKTQGDKDTQTQKHTDGDMHTR